MKRNAAWLALLIWVSTLALVAGCGDDSGSESAPAGRPPADVFADYVEAAQSCGCVPLYQATKVRSMSPARPALQPL